MELSIKWKMDFELVEDTDGKIERKKLKEPVWVPFDTEDILFHSRTYAIKLFSNGTPVIIKENDNYLVNRRELLEQYRAASKRVKMIQDCNPSTKSVIDVGFWS